MEITYERKHNESYMVLEGELNAASYEYRMIMDNNISAILDMNSFEIDGKKRISYKISRKENLSDYIETNDLTVGLLTSFVVNLQVALDEASRYLIDEEHFLLDKETIFLEKSKENCRVSLCYFPDSCGSVQTQFRDLMEYFVSKLATSDREASRKIYEAYELCLKGDYTLAEIIECLAVEEAPQEIQVEKVFLDEEEDEKEASDYEEYNTDAIGAEYISDYYEVEEGYSKNIVNTIIEKTKAIFGKMHFEDEASTERETSEDFVIEPDYEIDEKTVLLSDSKPVGRLVYDGNSNEDDFIINKDVFRIGTAQANDAVIHARTVSGNHAKITKEGNDYYITDSNSTNGSFLNSLPLVYRKPYKLKPMDVIRFATESYIFL
ncbi:Forkhead associated (FHA) domain, binds pSer, pThr, pTyr [Pseudobutyrivibrio sp. OR37]|uniref:DUF6382 domain-containing protein n=1 Tax=Pseudobutyrivibrio sp. OR37 TaxID=1798186 RepID=UPI0008F16AF7|nr:DUF6382 domain-containing protein [Pseudobutyrivibrio sp. OR37]SFH75938.1 Forkhead associated (FHA) domain, binds pSer, pThr, pTyr [Pseudobutyrivibrio sp. OR37]